MTGLTNNRVTVHLKVKMEKEQVNGNSLALQMVGWLNPVSHSLMYTIPSSPLYDRVRRNNRREISTCYFRVWTSAFSL